MDTWVANLPCSSSLGELGWEGCAAEEIPLSSCGLTPPIPAAAPEQSPPPSKSSVRDPDLWGISHLTSCLVHRILCPAPMVYTRGL